MGTMTKGYQPSKPGVSPNNPPKGVGSGRKEDLFTSLVPPSGEIRVNKNGLVVTSIETMMELLSDNAEGNRQRQFFEMAAKELSLKDRG